MNTMMKALRFVGDLDDDFYKDERQRDVWNEASAVGLQCILWMIYIGSAILPWVAGRTGAWISLASLIIAVFSSLTTIAYAASRDVDVYVLSKCNRPRVVISVVLYLVAVIGIFARLKYDSVEDTSSWIGALVGGIVGGGIAVAGVKLHQQRAKRREAAAELL